MRNRENSKTEQYEVWDAGTYQTGPTTPPKKSNPLVAVLLVMVIFLGGIASALGIINLRLLAALQQQQPMETLPLQLQQGSKPIQSDNAYLEAVPSIPEQEISMVLTDPATDKSSDLDTSCIVTINASETVLGYGIVLSEEGYILTFAHLLDQAERVTVTLPGGKVARAAIVGTDAYTDLAVLYINEAGLTAAQFGGKQPPIAGSKVTAICGQLISGGTVFLADNILQIGENRLPLLKTSAATGDEAGFLLSDSNQILGFISPRIIDFLCCSDEDLAYVIPSVSIKAVVDQLLSRGFAAGRPHIGANVEQVTDIYQNYWKLPDGLRITTAHNTTLQEGDILISINGQRITDIGALYRALFACRIGEEVGAVVYRAGEEISVTLLLQEAGS